MKVLITTIVSIFLLVGYGCEKALMEADPKPKPEAVFDHLWKDVDRKYSFFEFKNVDWDSVKQVYESRIRNGMSDQALFDTLASMLKTLKDGHVNLVSDFDRSRYWDWYLDYPQNFDFSLLEREYLKDDYRITKDFTIYYKIFDSLDIGYMYVPSFTGSNVEVAGEVIKAFQDVKGVVVDVRDNGGGSSNNAQALAGYFADRKRHYAFWQWKNGPEHDDFSKLIKRYVEPEGEQQFTKPVALLTNRSSYSATNDFALAMKALPHVTQIGDRTGGGGGVPYHSELPNGWTYRFSRSITWSPQMDNVEAGIKPDIQLDTNPSNRRTDEILERGFAYILNQ